MNKTLLKSIKKTNEFHDYNDKNNRSENKLDLDNV